MLNIAAPSASPGASVLHAARRRIRVVRIIDRLNVGGPAKHVVWLTAGLDPAAFETRLVTGTVPPGESDMGYFAAAAGVVPIVIPEMSRELGLRDLVACVRILHLLWRVRPDIVHTHKAKAGALGRVAAFAYRWTTLGAVRGRPRACRVVHTYHGHIFHSYYGPLATRVFLAVERWLGRMTDRVVVVSPGQRDEIAHRYRVAASDRIRVIPLGLDFDDLEGGDSAGLRGHLGIDDDTVLVGVVGRLTEVKDHATLLRAARHLRDLLPPSARRVRFAIVGDGSLRSALERLAQELDVHRDVVFLGFRPDATALAADLDVAALTSVNEGTPLSLIEAMCAGRPVAATEVGGVPDLLGRRLASQDGFSVWEHGVSAPPRDGAAFARALRFLVERPDLRREMGKRARDFAQTTFGKERLLRSIADLYAELHAAHR